MLVRGAASVHGSNVREEGERQIARRSDAMEAVPHGRGRKTGDVRAGKSVERSDRGHHREVK